MKLIFYFSIVCKELDDEFLKLAQTYEFKAGTTLLLSIIHNGRFTIANIGDSAAMLLKDNGTMLRLTDDQTPDRDDEYNRKMSSSLNAKLNEHKSLEKKFNYKNFRKS